MVPEASGAPQDREAERQASIGLVFLLLAGLAVLGAVWLAQRQFSRDYAVYDVELTGQVQGLARGGAVFINGVRAGEVIDVSLNQADTTIVLARIRVSADTPVRQDSTGTMEWLGVSGTRLLQLSGGTLSKPLLPRRASGRNIPVIRAAPSVFDRNNPDNKPAATVALEALDTLTERLSDQNLAAIGTALGGARENAAAWRGKAGSLATIDDQLRRTTQLTDEMAKSTDAMNDKVNGDMRRMLQDLAARSEETKRSIRSARAQIGQIEGSARAGLQGLQAIPPQAAQLAGAVDSASAVIDRLESQDAQLLGPGKSVELEVEP